MFGLRKIKEIWVYSKQIEYTIVCQDIRQVMKYPKKNLVKFLKFDNQIRIKLKFQF